MEVQEYYQEFLKDGCLQFSNPERVKDFEALKQLDPESCHEVLQFCKEAWYRDILLDELDERERLLLLLDLSNCENPKDLDCLVACLHRWSHKICNEFARASHVYENVSHTFTFAFEACYLFLLLAKYVHPSFTSYVDKYKHDLNVHERQAVEFVLDTV